MAKEYTSKILGKEDTGDFEGDWGDIPLQYLKALPQQQLTDDIMQQYGNIVQKAEASGDPDELLSVMKSIQKALVMYKERD